MICINYICLQVLRNVKKLLNYFTIYHFIFDGED